MSTSPWPSWWNAEWDAWFRTQRRWVVPRVKPPAPTAEMIQLPRGIAVPAGLPAGGAGVPAYTGAIGQTLVMQDPFTQYTSIASMGAFPAVYSNPYFAPQPSPVTDGNPVDSGASLITGFDGTGHAYRMSYSGANQESHNLVTLGIGTQPDNKSVYITHQARVTKSGSFGSTALNVKWLEGVHNDASSGQRTQWNTRFGTDGYSPPVPETWEVIDTGGEIDSCGAQPVAPWPTDVFDGNVHNFAYAYQPNSAPGARDGFQRMWVDGTKVLDVSAATIGVTPSGGAKVWCTVNNVDRLDDRASGAGIAFLRFGAVQTVSVGSTPAWTLDIDNVTWWLEARL